MVLRNVSGDDCKDARSDVARDVEQSAQETVDARKCRKFEGERERERKREVVDSPAIGILACKNARRHVVWGG